MTDPRSDDELLALLQRSLEAADPVPERVSAAARTAHTWHSIDAELAQLVYDSRHDVELAGVRSEGGSREITFEAPGVEIEITVRGAVREVVGQLVPPRATDVTITVGERVEESRTDDLGRFRFADVAPGPIRLTVMRDEPGRTIQTEWVVI